MAMSKTIFILLILTVFNLVLAADISCPDDWIDCGNGNCIAHLWRCDDDNDCGNMKDEEGCVPSRVLPQRPANETALDGSFVQTPTENGVPPKSCLSSQFQCREDGHCIPQIWKCDGEHDCDDGSDESGCKNDTKCDGFRCRNNHCIPAKWKCDGQKDCQDGSDESGCPVVQKVCSETEFTCSSGTCLNRSRVCDGKKDCSDASDEGRHCSELCANFTCFQKCRPTPKGPECYCNDGYVLGKDNKTCSDINECSTEGFCSQSCTNLMGSYRCSCMDGYELVNKTCRASGADPLLIFSTLQEIRAIYLRTKRYFPVHNAVYKAAAVDADPLESRVYWVEVSNKSSVYSSKIDGTGFSVILHNGLLVPEDIAVDYVARNLYFTDSGLKQILACKMDGSMCHVLHDTNIGKPRAIVLDPPEGQVYWSDWGDNTSGIYRSGMDGTRRVALATKDIKWPNGIAIDHTTNRLYWTDAQLQTIEYITLDGKTRKVLLSDNVFHPYSLAVFEDSLYWSDWNTFSLETCNKFTGHMMNVMTRENGKHIMGVHVYHPVLARTTNNPCWSSPCSHMCLIAPLNGFRCACPPGFTLGSNGRTCFINDRFPMLLVNDDTSIYLIRPEAVGSSAVSELPTTHIELIGKTAYDWKTKTLFVTDLKRPVIYAMNITTLIRRELVKNHIVTPEDIAFDWIGGNLYWVDSSKGTVEVISTANLKTTILIVDLPKPMAISLVPNLGKMFVLTIGDDPAIAMYDMDGKNRKALNAISGAPISIAVHPSAPLLYWADPRAETISSLDYSDPRSTPNVLKTRTGNVMSLAVNDKYLYWTDSKHHVLSLVKHNVSHSHTISLPGIRAGLTSRKVIYTAAPVSKRSSGDSCAVNNGGCSHLCLVSPTGKSCACTSGMELASNELSCKDKECTSEEFRCTNKKCVSIEFVCDGIKDCDDGSDETCDEKRPHRCPGNDFRCLNGRCILVSWKCDGRDDCGDNSDEIGCPAPANCTKDQFTCGNGACITTLWRCDGENDCNDSSDESDCHTTACDAETQLRCDHGQCIPKSWACDGAPDCFDSTDERNCTAQKQCTTREFRCDNGTCVDKSLVCDNRNDCEDGSDERNCSYANVTCKEGRQSCGDGVTCIYPHEFCDGYKDCRNGEDELNCTRSAAECSDEEYFCTNNSRCISRRWICDGDDDCGDAADEVPENCTRRIRATVPPYQKILDCEHFSCSWSGECIPWSKVCNGENDCEDLTDEGPLCAKACTGDQGGCSQKCQKTPQGSKCSCFQGYALTSDGVTCEDVNECDIPGSCSQFCNNTKGGFKCSCAEGYFLEFDHKKCKADGGTATLVYLLPDQIRGIDLGSRSQRVYVTGSHNADMRGIDYDALEGTFFWTDWRDGTISSFTPNTNRQDVLLTTLLRPHYIRYDWITKNIYYTDDEGSIMACTKNGLYCATVIKHAVPHISSMDISPTTGHMFWTVWESLSRDGSSAVERAELDGSHRTKIVSDRIVWPNSVTVDHLLKMVYWTDAKLNIMECTDFHGLKRRTVVSEGLFYPFSMGMFEDKVFWSDFGTDSMIRCDKFGGGNCTTLHRGNIKAEDVIVVHKVKQPIGSNRCAHNRCPHLCLSTKTNYVCKCDDKYTMESGGCALKPTTTVQIRTSEEECPENYCLQDAKCVVKKGDYVCQCPDSYGGYKCEINLAVIHDDTYDYSWVIGVVLSILLVVLIILSVLLCRQNRDKLTKVGESVAVTFRNTGLASRKSGRLVVDTDDGVACDELMLGKKGSFRKPGFGNPLFGKKPPPFDPESQDGDFKRWPSFDNDSAFASEDQSGESSPRFGVEDCPLDGRKSMDRLVRFFRK